VERQCRKCWWGTQGHGEKPLTLTLSRRERGKKGATTINVVFYQTYELGELDSPPSDGRRQDLDVEIQLELVGMWPQAHGIDFLAAFILEPGLDHILREHIAFGEKLVIVLQGSECPFE